ncbi:MAG: phospholipase C, phosphocholine-specific [Verrucomicrobiota bacterium]
MACWQVILTLGANRWFQKLTISGVAVLFVSLASVLAAPVQHQISAANIEVVQNDSSNNTTSVTVTTALSINDFRIRSGSNRADYNVQIGADSTDDVINGILLSSINQNGRDNNETNFPGMNYGASAIDSNAGTSPGSSGQYWIPVFQAPQDAEYNFNVAAAYFPYTNGWYGGWLNNASGSNGGANNHLIGHPSLVLGTHVMDNGSGKTTVNLLPFGLDARSNAVLIVCGGKNEANFALSGANPNGTWTITCHDDNGSTEQDYVAFVCVPLTNQTVIAGKFMGDARIAMQSAPFNITNTGVGTYHLVILGINPATGVLLVSPESGGANNGDNLVSYQINTGGWDIQTRDITAGFTPGLQTLPASDAVVSFVFIPGPTTNYATLQWFGAQSNTWDLSGTNNWRILNSATATNFADPAPVVFNDGAANFFVNVAATVSPGAVTFLNFANPYFIGGNGSISGAGNFSKQGDGKVTLATGNAYTGDTVVSHGILALGVSKGIPGGNGFGNLTVNGTLDLAGFSPVINNLSGSGAVDNLSAGGSPTLTINQTTNTTFSGMIKNSSGALALAVAGSGNLILAGSNNISGVCTVSNATLTVNGTLTASRVDGLSGAQLAGTGVITTSVTLTNNSALGLVANAPLTVGALKLNGVVSVSILGGISLTNAATYTLLQYGAKTGSGNFTLVLPPGLQGNGFAASLNDTRTQLELVVAPAGVTGTIADVRHVVIFMQENRSFDHYFGALRGVRGFNDRNTLLFTNGLNAFYQPTGATSELPFHTSIQCIADLNHSWTVTHSTVNNGWNDQWIPNKTAATMAFMDGSDLPYYYSLAESYTICDEYHCSVLSSTYPNRFMLMTGMVDPHGFGGGPEIDNSTLPNGFTWITYPERLTAAGIPWKVFQVTGSSSDNVLEEFAAYQQATAGNPLHDQGMVGDANLNWMLADFANRVLNNTLPPVSWVIAPGGYTEHPPDSPASGEYLTKQLLDALALNPNVLRSTVFILNYDENDGFFDHALPILPPPGTPDEFVGSLPIGLGIRVPCLIVSPWTRGGRVCSQVFDHTSVIRFLENWTGVKEPNISAWRRQVCGDLTSAFDFAHADTNYVFQTAISPINCSSGTTPSVPSPQIFPAQETGAAVALPLPYQPNACCTLDSAANAISFTLTNSGAASVHFGIYPNKYRNDGSWPLDVTNTQTAGATFSLAATAGKYDFTCYGPNGFQRRFAGVLSADYQKIEAAGFINPVSGGIKILLANTSASAVTFAVTNGYLAGGLTNISVLANRTNIFNVNSETNGGFYDVTVTASADSLFLRRFLGRVEGSGLASSLTASKNPSVYGESVTFIATFSGYATPTGSVQFKTNGVAVGAPVTLGNGSAAFGTQTLKAGTNWIAAEYSGDWLNPAATNYLTQAVAYGVPVISESRAWGGAHFQFSFTGPAGQPYRVLSTTNLAQPGSWSLVLTNSFGAAQAVFTETNAAAKSSRFYRVVSP